MRSKTNAVFMSLSQYIFLNKSIVLVLNIYYLSYGMIARSSGNERMFATCSVIDNSYTLNVSLNMQILNPLQTKSS